MIDDPDDSPAETLQEEAARWVARMREAVSQEERMLFEAWLRRGALHPATYERLQRLLLPDRAEIGLVTPGTGSARPARDLALASVLAGAVSALLVMSPVYRPARRIDHQALRRGGHFQYASLVGEIRRVRLPDGSSLVLDTDSLLLFEASSKQRLVRLVRGRVRLSISRDARPFLVIAGTQQRVTNAEILDVAVDNANVGLARQAKISSFAVQVPRHDGQPRYTADTVPNASPDEAEPSPVPGDWTAGIQSFDNASVLAVAREVNRYAVEPIRLGDPGICKMRITGRLHVNRPLQVARDVARALALRVNLEDNEIVLTRRPAKK